jgi:hypothetical protein
VKTIDWYEYDEFAWSAELSGIYGDVGRLEEPLADDGRKRRGPQMLWWYAVKPSGRRCEFPELYSYGEASTPTAAMNKAEKAMRKADREYPTASDEGW